jgi:hypothetical protein
MLLEPAGHSFIHQRDRTSGVGITDRGKMRRRSAIANREREQTGHMNGIRGCRCLFLTVEIIAPAGPGSDEAPAGTSVAG